MKEGEGGDMRQRGRGDRGREGGEGREGGKGLLVYCFEDVV